MENSELTQNDLQQVENAIFRVLKAFANKPEAGAFLLKYTVLPNSVVNNQAIKSLYQEILSNFHDQKALAGDVVEALQYIRQSYLSKGEKIKEYLDQQVENIMHYKAFIDYAKNDDIDLFST